MWSPTSIKYTKEIISIIDAVTPKSHERASFGSSDFIFAYTKL